MIERVDRTLWTELPDGTRVPPTSSAAYAYGNGTILPSLLADNSAEDRDAARERIYNPREDDWLRRGGSQRTSKYRSRMEKARKEFIQGGPLTGGAAEQPLQLQHAAGWHLHACICKL